MDAIHRWSPLFALIAIAISAASFWRAGGQAPAPAASGAASAPRPPVTRPGRDLTALQSASDVAEASVQSVVNISTTRVARPRISRDEAFFRRLWGIGPADREHEVAHSLGSGVIVSADGIVLTNNHVIDGASAIQVRLADGREFRAELVGADPRSDLAVLRIHGRADGLRPMPLADSDRVRLGEVVLAIGSPFGLGQSVTMGIVSAKGRADVHIVDDEDFIQTDAAINPGNSGGALVNLRGELVGVSTAIASSSGGSQGIGFAIPSNMARPIMKSILQNGRMVRGWLGIGIQQISPDLRRQFLVPDGQGVLVAEVHPGSPADRAGVARGDVILKIGPASVASPQQLRNAVAQSGAGATVAISVWRKGANSIVRATLDEAPDPRQARAPPPSAPPGPSATGVDLADPSAQLHARYAIPAELKGVVIVHVGDEGRGAAAGLRAGDVVLEVDRAPTTDAAALAERLRAGAATLLVWREGRAVYLVYPG